MRPYRCYGLIDAMASSLAQNFKYNQKRLLLSHGDIKLWKYFQGINMKSCEILYFLVFFKSLLCNNCCIALTLKAPRKKCI